MSGQATITIDAKTPAHSGSKSVHVISPEFQAFFLLSGAPVFPATSGKLYVRTYIRLALPMTGGHNTYFKAGAADPTVTGHETRVGTMNKMLMINQPGGAGQGERGFLSNENYYNDQKPGAQIAPGTWGCVEAFFDPANKIIDMWLDGKEIPDLHRTDWVQDPLGAFRFGFEKYAGPDSNAGTGGTSGTGVPAGSTEIWYDDIVVSDHPIGC